MRRAWESRAALLEANTIVTFGPLQQVNSAVEPGRSQDLLLPRKSYESRIKAQRVGRTIRPA